MKKETGMDVVKNAFLFTGIGCFALGAYLGFIGGICAAKHEMGL